MVATLHTHVGGFSIIFCKLNNKRSAHYLDNFIVAGCPGSDECAHNLENLLGTFRELRVPIAQHKVKGPATCLTFLGIEIDSMTMELRLPQGKLEAIQVLLREWQLKRHGTRRELESLLGHLGHACKVVRPGRRFLRRDHVTLRNHTRDAFLIEKPSSM